MWVGQQPAVISESGRNIQLRRDGLHVEAVRIRDVEDFPTQLEALFLGPWHAPPLGQAQIHVEETNVADLIACAGFTGKWVGKGIYAGRPALEDADDCVPRRVGGLEDAGVHRRDEECTAPQLPVCRPLKTIEHVEWQAARDVEKPGELPAADNGIEEAVSISGDEPALAEGKLHNPICVELVLRVMRPSWIRRSSMQQHCNFFPPSAWQAQLPLVFMTFGLGLQGFPVACGTPVLAGSPRNGEPRSLLLRMDSLLYAEK